MLAKSEYDKRIEIMKRRKNSSNMPKDWESLLDVEQGQASLTKKEKESLWVLISSEDETMLYQGIELAWQLGVDGDSLIPLMTMFTMDGRTMDSMSITEYYRTKNTDWIFKIPKISQDHPIRWKKTICLLLDYFPESKFWETVSNLDLSRCDLEVLPDAIGELKNLNELELGSNHLTTLPDSIGELRQLTYLNLSYNNLVDLPDSMSNLRNLEVFAASLNYLTSFPYVGGWRNLQKFVMMGTFVGTGLTELPKGFTDLRNLQFVLFTHHPIKELPKDIGKLKRLEYLFIEKAKLTKLPDSIVDIPHLYEINVNKNNIKKLPKDIGKLKDELAVLNLIGNDNISKQEKQRILSELPDTNIMW